LGNINSGKKKHKKKDKQIHRKRANQHKKRLKHPFCPNAFDCTK
jgi:hypothetical protein